ncbi:MAG: hypothetical protein AAF389_09485 [Gemmatimonadota bacterium]
MPNVEQAVLTDVEGASMAVGLVAATLTHSVFSENHTSFQHEHGVSGLHSHPMSGPWVHTSPEDDGPALGHHNLFEIDLSIEPDCPGGGSVLYEAQITGEGDPRVENGVVHYVMLQMHQACVMPIEGDDFLLEAAPYLTVESHATNAAGTARLYGSVQGSLAWQAESKGGSCAIDLGWDESGASLDDIGSLQVSGTMCGVDFSTPLTLD